MTCNSPEQNVYSPVHNKAWQQLDKKKQTLS